MNWISSRRAWAALRCWVVLGSLVALQSMLPAAPTASAPPYAVEDLFRESDIRLARLSPNGTQVAFLTTLGTGFVGIASLDVATGKVEPLVSAKDENIDFFVWKGDDYLVFGGDYQGNESDALRGFDVRARKVVPLADTYRERYAADAAFANIVSTLPLHPDVMIVSGRSATGSGSFGVYRLNIRNGRRTRVPGADEVDITNIVVDTTGDIRARSRYERGRMLHEYRAGPSESWKLIGSDPEDDAAGGATTWSWFQFLADNRTLFVLDSSTSDRGVLRALDTQTGELGSVLLDPAQGVVTALVLSPDQSRLLGAIVNSDRDRFHWFDEGRAKLQRQIDASLPGTENSIVSLSLDEKVAVVAASADRQPPVYFLLNLRRPGLNLIGKANARLDPARLSPMQSVTYPARDGLQISAYLTLPPGSEGKNLPLIINPHGGPYGVRDEWGWNPEVQALAQRGYAVLQPNYRGSGGYGLSFLRAGRGEWGRKMQDDLTDAVRWAIDQGIADPTHVAIYGASYGGYAAMAGVAFTPELYRCAVNYVGAVDLTILTGYTRRGSHASELYHTRWVGDDMGEMARLSPLNAVANIRVPTFHAYGDNDPRVDIRHWKRLEDELKKHGKPYERLREESEGHGFTHEQTRIKFYEAMLAFLDRHMQPLRTGETRIGEPRVIEMPAAVPPDTVKKE